MNTPLTKTKGYSLIEVLVAVAILMFSIVGPMTIAAKSIQSARFAQQQTTAFFLAQEGISMTESIRNATAVRTYRSGTDAWTWTTTAAPFVTPCTSTNGCNFSRDDSGGVGNVVTCTSALPYICTLKYDPANLTGALYPYHTRSNGDLPSIYKRTIKWAASGVDEMRITSTVEWNSTLLGGPQSVTIATSLFNKYDNIR